MMNDGKPAIENVTRKVLEDALKATEPVSAPAERKIPEGCVERRLTMRDRNAIIGACQAYCLKDGHKGLSDQARLNKVKKMLNWDETLEYFAMVDDALDDEIRAWRRAKSQYKLWKDYRAGLVKPEDIRKIYPDLDLENGVQKPQLIEPKLKPGEKRGPEMVAYFPSKLDAWIQDALQAMEWHKDMEELSVEVCEKFGIKQES